MFISGDSFKCTGCGVCRNVCSFVKTGELRPSRSFLRLRRKKVNDEVISCTQCGVCASKCPKGAIKKEGGVYRITDDCDGCGKCVDSCPQKLMFLADGRAWKCDLCGSCIEWCPVKALSLKGKGK